MKRLLADVSSWLRARVDASDVMGACGFILSYNGAAEAFGVAYARLGLGVFLLGLYVLAESLKSLRTKGGSR